MLTTKQILDSFFTTVKDNGSTLRARAIEWLHVLMMSAADERDWLFLKKTSAALTITANAVTLPADFSIEVCIALGTVLLTPKNKLTDEQAFAADNGEGGAGYTIEGSALKLHGETTETTAVVTYIAHVPDAGYGDSTTATIFPAEFLPLFVRSLKTAFLEYDVDLDRLPVSLQLDAAELRRMKRLDNRRRPQIQPNSHGYVRV